MDRALEAAADGYRLRGSPASGLALSTWGFFVGFAAVALYGPVAHQFKESMGISGIAVGLLVAAPQLMGTLLRIPFGAWVDRSGARIPMLTLLGLALVGVWGIAFILYTVEQLDARAYPVILILGILAGCGVATFSVGVPQVSYWFPRSRQGTALGLYGGIGNLAPGLFTLLLPLLLAGLGLANAYLVWFLFLLFGTVIYALFSRDAYYFQLRKQHVGAEQARLIAARHGQELFPCGSIWGALGTAASELRTWGLVFLYFTSFGGFLALTAWFPSYWSGFHGLDLVTAGLLSGIGFSLLSAISRVAGGLLADRFEGEVIAFMAFAAVLVGAVLLSFFSTLGIALAGAVVLAVGMGTGNAAVFMLLPKYVPAAVGGAAGWVGGLGGIGGFFIPPVLGAFVDAMGTQGYRGGFFVYVVLAAFSMAVVFGFTRLQSDEPVGG
ncbi:MAG: nitrate/nitrite transporter [Thiohalomonadaceae bacterium]